MAASRDRNSRRGASVGFVPHGLSTRRRLNVLPVHVQTCVVTPMDGREGDRWTEHGNTLELFVLGGEGLWESQEGTKALCTELRGQAVSSSMCGPHGECGAL